MASMFLASLLVVSPLLVVAWDRPSRTSSVLHGCGHTSVAGPDVPCPNHCEELSFPDEATRAKFLAAESWKYPKYSSGLCDANYSVFEAKWADKDFPSVSHVKRSTNPGFPITKRGKKLSRAASSNILPIPGRHQWPDRDGYCGSNSVQMNALFHGTWLSQAVVRQAVQDGRCDTGKYGNEVLHVNIGCALETLRFTHDDWDYKNQPRPQYKAYLVWLKQHLAQNHPVVWFIYCKGDGGFTHVHGPHGGEKGYGYYDHVEPVVGVASNHSLDPASSDFNTYFDDDVIYHHSDWSQTTYARRFDSLADGPKMDGNCKHVLPVGGGPNEAHPCIPEDVDYGYAMTGRIDPAGVTLPVQLSVDNWKEPNLVEGDKPTAMNGNITVGGLTKGKSYILLRYGSYKKVPTDSHFANSTFDHSHTFSASDTTYHYTDPNTILSDSSTYYYALSQRDFEDPPPAVAAAAAAADVA